MSRPSHVCLQDTIAAQYLSLKCSAPMLAASVVHPRPGKTGCAQAATQARRRLIRSWSCRVLSCSSPLAAPAAPSRTPQLLETPEAHGVIADGMTSTREAMPACPLGSRPSSVQHAVLFRPLQPTMRLQGPAGASATPWRAPTDGCAALASQLQTASQAAAAEEGG
jgi:hypothetical protein